MIGISGNPSTAGYSHNGGWTQVILNQIQNRYGHQATCEIVKNGNAIHEYDVVIINEGVNYKKGSWNFFGGMQERSVDMVKALTSYQGRVYAFNEDICWKSLLKRKELREAGFTIDDLPKVITINTRNNGPRLIIGDSHSISIHRSGYGISRNDGATLFGALKEGGILRNFDFNGISHVELYFGNIDVRFHLGRQSDPIKAAKQLVTRYLLFVQQLSNKGKHVTVQGLLPIENESRKIPGTGKYKGENFFGSQELRQELVDYINDKLEREAPIYGGVYRGWNLPQPLPFGCMEARQSVHLRPDYYLKNKNNGTNQTTIF